MSLFDKDLAIERAGNSFELARELFEMLISDLPNSQKIMLHAHSTLNKDSLWDAVHKVHGGTAYCGVPDLQIACKELEDHIKDTFPSPSVDTAFESLQLEITKLLNEAEALATQLKKT